SLRNAPEVRIGSVERSFWNNLPVYVGFDAFAGGVSRSQQGFVAPETFSTPDFVGRQEFAPRVTVPMHFGDWLGITATAGYRATRYGDSFNSSGLISGQPIVRNTGEFGIDLSLPRLQRVFQRPKSTKKYKHTIEPELKYRYVTGVNN